MSLTSSTLFQGELVTIWQVLCRPHGVSVGEEERSPRDTLVLPGRGRFLQYLDGDAVLAEPTQALLFAADRPYRVSHPDPHGDDCLSLHFSETAMHEALEQAAAADRLDDPALRTHAHLTPAALTARAILWRRLARGTATPLEAEEVALALLASALERARRGPVRTARRRRRNPPRVERALAVRDLMLQRPQGAWRLADLARRVHTTPFHLARGFREEVGMPVHQYHLRVRLAHALDWLLDTDRTLSEVALACGFASHSHFTETFRRQVGVSPARVRGSVTAAHAAETLRSLRRGGPAAGTG